MGVNKLVIQKPAAGTFKADSCATVCTITTTNSHSWFVERNNDYVIETSDVSLVSQQDSVTITDIEISTTSPGSCNDSFFPQIILKNPC